MGQEMSGGGDKPAPGAILASARRRYEEGTEPVFAIAADVGFSVQALIAKARTLGWTLRGSHKAKAQGTRKTIVRLKAMLQQRLSDLEGQTGDLPAEPSAASSDRDIRSMNTLVRTLEKVLELERKERAQRKQLRHKQHQFNDAERDALAEKLEGLGRELQSGSDPQAADGPGGDAPQS